MEPDVKRAALQVAQRANRQAARSRIPGAAAAEAPDAGENIQQPLSGAAATEHTFDADKTTQQPPPGAAATEPTPDADKTTQQPPPGAAATEPTPDADKPTQQPPPKAAATGPTPDAEKTIQQPPNLLLDEAAAEECALCGSNEAKTTLPLPAGAAAEACALCGSEEAKATSPLPARAAAAKHALNAAAPPFHTAAPLLLPPRTTACPLDAANAPRPPADAVRGALGAPPIAVYFSSSGGCARDHECWFSHAELTKTQLRRAQRRKAGTLTHASRRKKKRKAAHEKVALSKSQRNQKDS